MAEVNLVIHSRNYGVGCDDGQERRVRDLGAYIDKKIREIAGAAGNAGESHLLVLGALVMADELFETRESMQQMRNQIAAQAKTIEGLEEQLTNPAQSFSDEDENQDSDAAGLSEEAEAEIVETIDTLAGRIESIARRLQHAA